ncbi:ribosomal 30S subunit maturation factor RimM [Rhodopseudomonas julia]|uniref:Ribosomal 30S subunit maturation factor RimM n=1 Tax=Rhodopseudomonas julia TaxID=200617 RepID=A0ABU0C184_9BRAD|nr:PRC-barrel domain-containing protein [Rhodopseudomonas julia]MDQ0324285.1 ribosomal 30S subunit maturation factor RimM [Rhodopseudomonas julia]
MKIKLAAMSSAAVLLATGLAFAQGAWVEVEDDDMAVNIPVDPPTYTVGDLDDMEIVGQDGEEIGEVNEILASGDGSSMAVVTDVGGFLGMGERNVVIPLTDARIHNDQIIINMTKDQIESLDEWAK